MLTLEESHKGPSSGLYSHDMKRKAVVLFVVAGLSLTGLVVWRQVVTKDSLAPPSVEPRVKQFAEQCRRPWKRPVLHGTARAGNAGAAQLKLFDELGDVATIGRKSFLKALARPSSQGAIQADIKRHADTLDALLATTTLRESWTPIERGIPPKARPWETELTALQWLLLRGANKTAQTCLQTVANVIRIAQDSRAGAGVLGLGRTLDRVFRDATAVLNHCSQAATHAELESAHRSLSLLLQHPIPIGHVLETEIVSNLHLLVFTMQKTEANRLYDALAVTIPRLRKMTAQDLPSSLEIPKREAEWLHKQNLSEFAFEQVIKPVLTKYATAGSRSEARLRLMVAALEIQLAGVPTEPPASLSRKALRDPFTGDALHWLRLGKCAGVWSVGPDKKSQSRVEGDRFNLREDDLLAWACPPRIKN